MIGTAMDARKRALKRLDGGAKRFHITRESILKRHALQRAQGRDLYGTRMRGRGSISVNSVPSWYHWHKR